MGLTATQRAVLVVALAGVVIGSLAVLALRLRGGGAGPAQFTPPPQQPAQVQVSVRGAVVREGTYWVSEGSRVEDVLEVAGGLRPDADASQINPTARVYEGTLVYVPVKPSPPPYQPPAGVNRSQVGLAKVEGPRIDHGGSPSPHHQPTAPAGRVNVNTASAQELVGLPGIGPTLAQRIIEYRSTYGRFTCPEDLAKVRGIGPQTVEKLRPYVSF